MEHIKACFVKYKIAGWPKSVVYTVRATVSLLRVRCGVDALPLPVPFFRYGHP